MVNSRFTGNQPSNPNPGDGSRFNIGLEAASAPSRSAAELLSGIRDRLPAAIALDGNLRFPNERYSRSERTVHLTERPGNSPVEKAAITIRLDAFDIGSLLFSGQQPKENEPSYREAGAIAITWLMETFKKHSDAFCDNLSAHLESKGQTLPPDFGFCLRSTGLRFDLRSKDLRFGVIEFRWQCDPLRLNDALVPEIQMTRSLLDYLNQHRENIFDQAVERYPLAHALRHEEHGELSPSELETIGADPQQYHAIKAIEMDVRLEDVCSVSRELYEPNSLAPTLGASTSNPRSPSTFKGESEQAWAKVWEQADAAKLQELLVNQRVAQDSIGGIEEDLRRGVRFDPEDGSISLLLELDTAESGMDMQEIMSDLQRETYILSVRRELLEHIDLKFTEYAETDSGDPLEVRNFVELIVKPPPFGPETTKKRDKCLEFVRIWIEDNAEFLKRADLLP